VLKVADVAAGYGRFSVLRGINLTVPLGDFRLIIGPNGAGKTTLLRTLFGLVKPAQGTIKLCDRDITGLQPRTLLDLGIAYTPQQSSIFPHLTVQDNLEMGLFQVSNPDPTTIESVFERFEALARRRTARAQTLSGGERRLLEIARALMIKPRLLLLDEPSLGLSPLMMERVLTELSTINSKGVTVILVEQRVKAAAAVAKSISVMRLGRLVQEGQAKDARDPRWLADALYGSGEAADMAAYPRLKTSKGSAT
jgi:ABC-type branched-subunit amino acid transport system ATPase component